MEPRNESQTAPVPKRLELPDLQASHRCRHRDPMSPTRPAYPQRNAQSGKRHEERKHRRIRGKIVGRLCETSPAIRLNSMQHGDTIQFTQGVAKVSQLRDLQNCDAWKRALQHKCKDRRYYEIVEETLECGFEHHYLLLEDASGNVPAI